MLVKLNNGLEGNSIDVSALEKEYERVAAARLLRNTYTPLVVGVDTERMTGSKQLHKAFYLREKRFIGHANVIHTILVMPPTE
ncbi:hypothetical protein LSAT2_018583 [Lamellibrachia satsuma]|nr:hypothetical protein LSAT2_018583 [Lamellibrachia satsuma]